MIGSIGGNYGDLSALSTFAKLVEALSDPKGVAKSVAELKAQADEIMTRGHEVAAKEAALADKELKLKALDKDLETKASSVMVDWNKNQGDATKLSIGKDQLAKDLVAFKEAKEKFEKEAAKTRADADAKMSEADELKKKYEVMAKEVEAMKAEMAKKLEAVKKAMA